VIERERERERESTPVGGKDTLYTVFISSA
jgi:hypothetical protein